jgi:BirA family transcriptional regulator, biotin operon repressor / biotin---[acetyl-CoA-carboxylase] ligase
VSGEPTPEAVLPLLTGRLGRPYRYVAECESTQRLLGPEAPEGETVVANHQSAGRGRLGRDWEAAPGTSVLLSVCLRPSVEPARLPELTVVAASAVAGAIAAETGLDPTLKHPNDVLVSGRKVAGILAEASEGRVVLGIGVNANQTAGELPETPRVPASSLALESGREVDRARLVAAILNRLGPAIDAWATQRA